MNTHAIRALVLRQPQLNVGAYYDNGCYCVSGLLHKAVGCDLADASTIPTAESAQRIEEQFGVALLQIGLLSNVNDSGVVYTPGPNRGRKVKGATARERVLNFLNMVDKGEIKL